MLGRLHSQHLLWNNIQPFTETTDDHQGMHVIEDTLLIKNFQNDVAYIFW